MLGKGASMLGKAGGPRYIKVMNAHVIPRDILKLHIAAVEENFPLRFIGMLPKGSAGHLDESDERALEFLADDLQGLSLLDLCKAEIELGRHLGRSVGIVLHGGLKSDEAATLAHFVAAI
jgi:hypothetical protein